MLLAKIERLLEKLLATEEKALKVLESIDQKVTPPITSAVITFGSPTNK
ncbi:MAG TPA: hypothetical protein VKR58_14745 [Aquella sp.]|nr:hypothetical protein [Aquella sp.]